MAKRDLLSQKFENLLGDFDALICPVTVGEAFKHRRRGAIHTPFHVGKQSIPGNLAATGFTSPFNLTGHPVITIPLTRTKKGLPLGIQIVGKIHDDFNLLETARSVDRIIKEKF